MQKSISSFKLGDEYYYSEGSQSSFKCNGCGEEFRKPLLATVSSNISIEKYYACPRCLTKVRTAEKHKCEESDEDTSQPREVKRIAAKLEENVACSHFVGYLKSRPRNTPFPEECLTCSKMIDCLTH
jgi:DNA-directed RNA polymerase subunit RPC12/RpoP